MVSTSGTWVFSTSATTSALPRRAKDWSCRAASASNAAAAGSADRVRPGGDGVIALGPDRLGQRAPRVLAGLEPVEHPAEVVGGPPAQRGAGAGVDIDAVDHAEHRPAAPRVLR